MSRIHCIIGLIFFLQISDLTFAATEFKIFHSASANKIAVLKRR